jgi:hypothetical protein
LSESPIPLRVPEFVSVTYLFTISPGTMLAILVPNPFPEFARSNFIVPALMFWAVVLKAVALRDAMTL